MSQVRSVGAFSVWCVSVSFAVFTSACWSYDASVTAGGSGGSTGLGGKVGMGPNCNRGVVPAAPLPCDVLEGAGNKCVSAHSTVRLLVRNYTGCLYQVQRTDMTTQDIGVVDGYADAAAQEAFCANTACVISIVYDQAPFGNRSEERRVGKECGSRWSAYREQKKRD